MGSSVDRSTPHFYYPYESNSIDLFYPHSLRAGDYQENYCRGNSSAAPTKTQLEY